jgi:electron transfer flavoprotein beta subunit
MTVAACMKLVDWRPVVDPLTGAVSVDARTSGASEADLAALEWALRLGEAWSTDVVALSAGGADVEPMLRDAVAAGASSARRVAVTQDAPSEVVAAALASVLPGDVDVVVCGDWSLDRGSGAVPALLAAHRASAQALGLVTLAVDGDAIVAERRLDGGRRERLRVARPAVLSVEGASARLRRAPLGRVVTARDAIIDVVHTAAELAARPPHVAHTSPYRPRPRVLEAPSADLGARERILALAGVLVDREPPQRLVLDPDEAAGRLIDQLRRWGYLDEAG